MCVLRLLIIFVNESINSIEIYPPHSEYCSRLAKSSIDINAVSRLYLL